MTAYFEQLSPVVLSNLQRNLSDFIEIDQQSLEGYDGNFLHAHNNSSTSLVLLNKPSFSDGCSKDRDEFEFFKLENPTFILGSAGKIRQISRQKAREIWLRYSPQLTVKRAISVDFINMKSKQA